MHYATLGSTDLTVSALGYGASPLGSVFRAVDEAAGIRAVRTALDLGINFIDVSPAYGETVAETVLGRALQGVDRASYVLATKVGRYGPAAFDFTADRARRSVDESLGRLGVDYIDLIQAHDIEFGDTEQIIHQTLPALQELKDSGKVRYIGVTGYPLRPLIEVATRSHIDTVLSYCRLTLADQGLEARMDEFAAQRTGIINASPLAMGALTTRGAPSWHPGPTPLMAACARAAQLCRSRGSSIEQLALQYSVSQPGPATTVVGTADPDNITRNVSWLAQEIDQQLLAEVLEILRPVKDLTWPSGRPENADPVAPTAAV